MKTRIAPTPSGYLHAGNGAAFVLAWMLAREAGGKVLLRIDDLDAERARPEYAEDIFAILDWLGVDWDEGPADQAELGAEWSQQLRLAEYRTLVNELREGGHLYACDCSRKDISDRVGNTEYDGHCRDRDLDLDAPDRAWRLRMPHQGTVEMRTWPDGDLVPHVLGAPDPVVLQRNGRPAYQIASLADDLLFKVDTIIRGMDLLPSTLMQLHMARLLGRSEFREAIFLHHPLVVDATGEKLSKSSGAGSLRQWREAGRSPQGVHALALRLLRSPQEVPLSAL